MTIAELRALMGRATPGPLSIGEYGDIKAPGIRRHNKLPVSGVSIPCGSVRTDDISHANRDFIVALVNNAERMMAVVEAAQIVDRAVGKAAEQIAWCAMHDAIKAWEASE